MTVLLFRGPIVRTGQATLSGTGALSATPGSRDVFGQATLTAVGDVAVNTVRTTFAASVLYGWGDASIFAPPAPNRIYCGGIGSLTAVPSHTVYASASLGGAGSMQAIPKTRNEVVIKYAGYLGDLLRIGGRSDRWRS